MQFRLLFHRFRFLIKDGSKLDFEFLAIQYYFKIRSFNICVQAALVIRGLFICEFAYSHWQKWSKMTIFKSKTAFLSAISRFAVQSGETYLPRITRETCTLKERIYREFRGPTVLISIYLLLVFRVLFLRT